MAIDSDHPFAFSQGTNSSQNSLICIAAGIYGTLWVTGLIYIGNLMCSYDIMKEKFSKNKR